MKNLAINSEYFSLNSDKQAILKTSYTLVFMV
jgi:hypothetical protein